MEIFFRKQLIRLPFSGAALFLTSFSWWGCVTGQFRTTFCRIWRSWRVKSMLIGEFHKLNEIPMNKANLKWLVRVYSTLNLSSTFFLRSRNALVLFFFNGSTMSAGAPSGLYFSAQSVISLSIGIISIAFSVGRYKNLDLFVGAVCFVTNPSWSSTLSLSVKMFVAIFSSEHKNSLKESLPNKSKSLIIKIVHLSPNVSMV